MSGDARIFESPGGLQIEPPSLCHPLQAFVTRQVATMCPATVRRLNWPRYTAHSQPFVREPEWCGSFAVLARLLRIRARRYQYSVFEVGLSADEAGIHQELPAASASRPVLENSPCNAAAAFA